MSNFKSKEPIELQPTDYEMTEYVRVRKDEYEELHKRLFELANMILILEKQNEELKEWLEEEIKNRQDKIDYTTIYLKGVEDGKQIFKDKIDKVRKVTSDYKNWLQDSDFVTRERVDKEISIIEKILNEGSDK